MNSLYGKFGMRPDKSIIEIFDMDIEEQKVQFNENTSKYADFVHDVIEIEQILQIKNR